MTETELYRALLDEHGIKYETHDNENYLNTYVSCSLAGEPYDVDFCEPICGKPGTLGMQRDLTFTSTTNITAEEAFKVLSEAVDG